MNIIKDNTFNSAVKIICLMALIVIFTIGITVYKADIPTILIFAGFVVFYVQLPGLFILRMLRIRTEHLTTQIIIGLFTGWAFVVAEYFITDFIHTNILLYAAGPICSILYIIAKALNRRCDRNYSFCFCSLSTAFCIFIVPAFLYSMLNTQFLYMDPAACDYTYMNADKAYHMGLINSLSHDYPLISPWVQGREIHYHIFTELLYSVPVRLFGLTADKLLLTCGPLMTTYVLGLSFYAFFNELSSRKGRAGLYCLLLMLSNIYITREITDSIAFLFIFKNENAAGFGVSAALVFVVLFKYWYDRYSAGEKSLGYFLLLTAFIMLVTGIKGPMGLVLLGAMWGTFILGIIMRSVRFRTALPLIIITLAFLVIYVLILGSKGQSNGSGNSMIAFATIANIAFYRSALVAFMQSLGIPKLIRLGVMLVVFMIFLLTAFILPFTAGYIRELYLVLTRKRSFDFTRIVVYAACAVGLIAMFLLNYSGHSQIYFGFVTVFFAPMIAFWYLEDIEANKSAFAKAVRAVFIGCLVLTAFTLAGYYSSQIDEAKGYLDTHRNYNRYLSISEPEYEAMEWLRTNTPEDSLLATDRYYSVPLKKYSYKDRWTNRFFLYAVYSNRFCYIAGSGYNFPAGDWVIRREMIQTNNKLFKPNNKNRAALAKELGVDYVIVSKRFTKLPSLEGNGYRKCFSNSDIDIYEVQ